jgi:hypothetical protein
MIFIELELVSVGDAMRAVQIDLCCLTCQWPPEKNNNALQRRGTRAQLLPNADQNIRAWSLFLRLALCTPYFTGIFHNPVRIFSPLALTWEPRVRAQARYVFYPSSITMNSVQTWGLSLFGWIILYVAKDMLALSCLFVRHLRFTFCICITHEDDGAPSAYIGCLMLRSC